MDTLSLIIVVVIVIDNNNSNDNNRNSCYHSLSRVNRYCICKSSSSTEIVGFVRAKLFPSRPFLTPTTCSFKLHTVERVVFLQLSLSSESFYFLDFDHDYHYLNDNPEYGHNSGISNEGNNEEYTIVILIPIVIITVSY